MFEFYSKIFLEDQSKDKKNFSNFEDFSNHPKKKTEKILNKITRKMNLKMKKNIKKTNNKHKEKIEIYCSQNLKKHFRIEQFDF